MSAKPVTRAEYERLCGEVKALAAELATLRRSFIRSEILQRTSRQALADDKLSDTKALYKTKLTLAAAKKWRRETQAALSKYKLTSADFAEAVNVRPNTLRSYLYGSNHRVPLEVAKRTRGMLALIADNIEKTQKKTLKK